MCGIVGFFGEGNKQLIQKMTDAMEHRGPDDTGFYVNHVDKVYLGHKRLSIVDLETGQQPMFNIQKTLCIVFNGEIYNHRELKNELELKGYKFKSDHSDTEVILNGFEEWGVNVLNRLNGMFAFAIYVPQKKYFFLARDRFGEKPLYYFQNNNNFIFSSELKSLKLHFKVSKAISSLSLQKYLAYGYIPSPLTIYNKIYKLPAGHFLEYYFNKSNTSVKKYWDFKIEPDNKYLKCSTNEVSEHLEKLLSASVKSRMNADVPLGFFLSGGLDSSLLVALASKFSKKNKIKTFSIGFENKSFDESRFSQQVSNNLNTDHYKKIFSEKDLLNLVNEVLNKIDEPIADPSLLPTYLISKFAKESVNTVITGDGADELFGGYAPFKAIKPSKLYSKIIHPAIHKIFLNLVNIIPVSHSYMSLDFKIKRSLNGLSYPSHLWNPVWMSHFSKKEIEDLLMQKVNLEEIYSEAIQIWNSIEKKDEIDKSLEFFTKLYLTENILVKVDRSSMMNSLECRAPYLDNEVVEFARKLPNKFKIFRNETKYILKKTAEKSLPTNIIYKKKQGFSIPIGQWFKEGTISFDKYKINRNTNLSGVNVSKIKNLVKEHKNGKADNRLSLFNLLTLQKSKILNF